MRCDGIDINSQNLQICCTLYSLSEKYKNSYEDFENHNFNLRPAYQPHTANVNQVIDHLQMKLIELLEDHILKSLFDGRKDPIKT